MDPFVDQLKQMCAAHPTRAKWVFVPSHAIGRTLADRLVLEGSDWANLRFVTPLDLALRMGAPFLVERGIDPSEEGLGAALVMRLLLDLGDAAPDTPGYFRPLASQPKMAHAVWSTVRELRMSGVRSTDLTPDCFDSAAKGEELRALLGRYERYLDDTRRADMAAVYEEALQHLDWCPIQRADCRTEVPDTIWAPVQRRLIDAMPGEPLIPHALAIPEVAVPRRLSIAPAQRIAPRAASALPFLMAPEQRIAPAPPGAANASQPARFDRNGPEPLPHLFHAGGPDAEVEEVFRRVLALRSALDDVEIVCGSAHYAPLIWEKAMRYEWPVTLAAGIDGSNTRPGRALLALTDWIEDDFAAGRLRRLLESGDVRMGDDSTISCGRAARLLVKAEASWGRDTYGRSLARLEKSARKRAERDDLPVDQRQGLERRAREAVELADWIGTLLARVPAPDADGRIDLARIVDGALTFVGNCTARTSALDAFAGQALAGAIGELRALGDLRCPLDQALRFLRERVDSVTVGVDRPRPGHVHVSTLGSAGYAGRPHVFVVGLEEGRVFPAAFEDPVLLDAERARISPLLPRANDRIDEAVYAALARLATLPAARGTVTFSYSCRDPREYRPTYASWLMLQAYRLASGHPNATYHELHAQLGQPASCVPAAASAASGPAGWWLLGGAKGGDAARADVFRAYPALHAGATARDARDSSMFTAFDGDVPVAGIALDPCAPGAIVSATELEEAARCPFRRFLRRGLGVEAIESGERDRDIWLDPLLRGSLLHDLYADLLRRCRAEGRRTSAAEDAAWFDRRGRQVLEDLAIEMPPPSVEVRDRETRLFLDDLALFVDAEASLDPSRTPIAFEVSFGRADDSAAEPLARAEPVVIDIGHGLALRLAGRIDRIDRVQRTADAGASATIGFEIIDYKTGGYWPKDWEGRFAGGQRLQHALYGLAANELLKRLDPQASITAAEYYFSSAKGHQERKRIPVPSREEVDRVLADLRAVIASGLFVHATDKEACRFCDYGHACGDAAAARAEAKLGDPRLAPYLKLTAHE